MSYRALFFDNDGVLVDTEGLYFQASREVLAELGIELSHALHLDISLRQGKSVFELALRAGVAEAELPALRARRDARYSELLQAGVAPIGGVLETLGALRERHRRDARRMAVVTSCLPEHFWQIHTDSSVVDHFDLVWTPDRYGPHKPHPEPYLTAAAELGVAPGDGIAVEDSPRGVASARSAGMYVIGMRSEFAGDAVDLSQADVVLNHIGELVTHLDSL
ncbi:MAG: HAD family phosphatase [Myxococcales bacterium]|nr:HAD family phosphatase [Myxococcales bacterium]